MLTVSHGMGFPPMMGAVVTARNAHIAMAIPTMGYVLAWVFAVHANMFERKRMDTHRETDVGIVSPLEKELSRERNISNLKHTAEITEVKK